MELERLGPRRCRPHRPEFNPGYSPFLENPAYLSWGTAYVNCSMPSPCDDMAMGMYTRERVLAKTFAWRIIATLTGAAVAGMLTGEIETAGWFIVIEFPLKMGFYYVHERAWEAVEWGVADEMPSV